MLGAVIVSVVCFILICFTFVDYALNEKKYIHKSLEYFCITRIFFFLKMRQFKTILLFMLSCLLLSCAQQSSHFNAHQVNPVHTPTINITTFTGALHCMDAMLSSFDIPTILITAQDIPNLTAEEGSNAGTKDMLISSLSKLGQYSRKVRFVSYGSDLHDIVRLHTQHKNSGSFQIPDFFIRGSISQMDKNVSASRYGASIDHAKGNSSFSAGKGYSYISLDLNVGLMKDLQILPGISSSNMLAILDKGFGSEAGGSIKAFGAYLDFGVDRRDGIGQSIRNLMDLGVIEIIGKLASVPYMSCLPINRNHPEAKMHIYQEHQRYMQQGHLIRVIQGKMKQHGFYTGAVNGMYDQAVHDAIIEYLKKSRIFYDNPKQLEDINIYNAIVYPMRQRSNFSYRASNTKNFDLYQFMQRKQ